MPGPRYAIYYAPPQGTELDRFGSRWLGRSAWDGERLVPPALPGISAERHAEITRDARRYGFHGTLKPPFALAGGASLAALDDAVGAFAAERPAFFLPPLILAVIGGFVALVPSVRNEALHRLADDAVRDLDRFRAPAPAAELARRRRTGLTARQEEYLEKWGYPYVLDEFRFHLTLTARLGAEECDRVMTVLAPLVAPLCRDPLPIDAVCLFEEAHPGAPFQIVRSHAFYRNS